MRWFISKTTILFLFSFLLCGHLLGQDSYLTSFASVESNKLNGYEKRVHKYKERWAKLIPSTATIQYAGSMGLVSLGPGWNYGRKNQWETKIQLGFLPKFSGERSNFTLTLKENYVPWSIQIGKKGLSIEPLMCGLYVNTILNSQDFWVKQANRYPDGYYWFSSRIRTNVCLGQSFTWHIPNEKRRLRNSLSFFYEVSTNDFYVIAFAKNSIVKINDIFHLSLGVRTLIF